jgi:hypothetical protein
LPLQEDFSLKALARIEGNPVTDEDYKLAAVPLDLDQIMLRDFLVKYLGPVDTWKVSTVSKFLRYRFFKVDDRHHFGHLLSTLKKNWHLSLRPINSKDKKSGMMAFNMEPADYALYAGIVKRIRIRNMLV